MRSFYGDLAFCHKRKVNVMSGIIRKIAITHLISSKFGGFY